jgi:hypothetical protein
MLLGLSVLINSSHTIYISISVIHKPFANLTTRLTVICIFNIWSEVVLLLAEEEPSWSWSYSRWIYYYLCNQCLSPLTWVWTPLKQAELDTTLCDTVCQWLAAGRWFAPGTPVSSNNKTDRHDITEILLYVALRTTNTNPTWR